MRLSTDLLEYQKDAVEKLVGLRVGALFMDMGTGKTRTAMELVARREDKISKVIWFCPVSLKETVRQELHKHIEEPNIYCFDHKTSSRSIPEAFWYVVGIESMSSSNRVILTANEIIDEKTCVIVDESSYIKGHRSKRTEWITRISQVARYRLILTGTPISQGVIDLFAQMRFLSPKILGYKSFYSFAANHLEYHEKYKRMVVRAHNTEWLAAKMQPYVYQVTKGECLDLPDKLYQKFYVEMTADQRSAYDEIKDRFLQLIEPDDWTSVQIFRLFGALQQVVNGFYNEYSDEGGKLIESHVFEHERIAILREAIDRIPDGEKIIIWCRYEFDLSNIKEMLEKEYGKVSIFYGKLNERQRNEEVDKWRQESRFFLSTPSCGGHGLTLNEAAYVIFYNNSYKYSERLQAEDRCHRIGQDRPVTYIDLVCMDSIDERIMASIDKKEDTLESLRREIEKVKGDKAKMKDIIKRL